MERERERGKWRARKRMARRRNSIIPASFFTLSRRSRRVTATRFAPNLLRILMNSFDDRERHFRSRNSRGFTRDSPSGFFTLCSQRQLGFSGNLICAMATIAGNAITTGDVDRIVLRSVAMIGVRSISRKSGSADESVSRFLRLDSVGEASSRRESLMTAHSSRTFPRASLHVSIYCIRVRDVAETCPRMFT